VRQKGHGKSRGLYFFLWKRKRKSSIGNRVFGTPQNSVRVKRVEFASNRMLYIVLRGRWCSIIVLTVHAHSEEKSDDSSVTSVTTYLPTPHNIREERRPQCGSLSCY